MLSYLNDEAVKLKYQQCFEAHRKADEVIQGIGFRNSRGCFIGCTLDEYNHSKFSDEIGPEWLAHLADAIFEGIPKNVAPQFGTDLLAAIPVGKDLEPVRWKLAILRHRQQLEALKDNNEAYAEQVRKSIQGVIEYCEAKLAGTDSEEQRRSAWLAADSAAWSAESAWLAAAWSAARSATESAEKAAESASYSAAESTRSAARSAVESALSAVASAHFEWERDTLLSLLRDL